MSTNDKFKDIDFRNYKNNLYGVDALNKAIENITVVGAGKVPSFPEFCDNSGILFEPLDIITISNYKTKIQSAFSKYDSRFILNDLSVSKSSTNPNQLNVTIKYTIRDTSEVKQTDITVG